MKTALRGVATTTLVLAFWTSGALAQSGNTLDDTIVPGGSAFGDMRTRSGEPHRTRTALAAARPGRAARRRSLLFFAQLTDPHVVDEMSPARLDFFDPAGGPLRSVWRPQEALTTFVWDSAVRATNANRVSRVRQGDGSRRRLDLALLTGDLIDNVQVNETRWYVDTLDGRRVDPFSGKSLSDDNRCPQADEAAAQRLNEDVAARRYTGIQDFDDYPGAPADRYTGFWDPDVAQTAGPHAGFPVYPGLMDRAQRPFDAEGLRMPWYTTRGNHEGLLQGSGPANAMLRAIATGCLKVFPSLALDPARFADADESEVFRQIGDPSFIATLLAGGRSVPPDPDRRILSTEEYKREIGRRNGYRHVAAAENRASDGVAAYYSFRPRRGLEFVSLDTVAEGGGSTGNLDDPQYRWLEKTLRAAQRADRLVIAYGHHTLATLSNTRTDEQAGACSPPKPGCDADPRKSTPLHRGTAGAKNVRDLFLKYPNVIAYVAGHTHENRVDLFRKGRSGFWQINTASHVDWPQQSRLVEVMDNRDGTLSLFGTLLDQAAPVALPAPGTAAESLTLDQVGSLSRVLSWNDPQRAKPDALGREQDRNVELLLRDPRE